MISIMVHACLRYSKSRVIPPTKILKYKLTLCYKIQQLWRVTEPSLYRIELAPFYVSLFSLSRAHLSKLVAMAQNGEKNVEKDVKTGRPRVRGIELLRDPYHSKVGHICLQFSCFYCIFLCIVYASADWFIHVLPLRLSTVHNLEQWEISGFYRICHNN